jgi:hypothetical protein
MVDASALKDIKEMVSGLDMLGRFVSSVFKNKYALLIITLSVVFVMFANILRMLFSRIPMFRGNGDQEVNKYGNITAWCMSALAVVSIGWQTKGKVDVLVQGLSGPYGIFLILALSITLFIGVYRGFEGLNIWARRFCAIAAGGGLYFWMMAYITGGGWQFWVFCVAITIGFVLGAITHLRGGP